MKTQDFEKLVDEIETPLRSLFSSLAISQQVFINYCALNGKIHYCQNERFSDEEKSMSDQYKIKTIMKKVLSLEYDENPSLACLPGSTITFHAVISIPDKIDEETGDNETATKLASNINQLKKQISDYLKPYTDERIKINGEWEPLKKHILMRVGKARCNLKQLNRRLNIHQNDYEKITLSGTRTKPIYRKSKEEINTILDKLNSEKAKIDKDILKVANNTEEFAFCYEEYYDTVLGNFKYKEDIIDNEKNYLTQKISSPIYIIHQEKNEIELPCLFRNKKTKVLKLDEKHRDCEIDISNNRFLYSIPVYKYV